MKTVASAVAMVMFAAPALAQAPSPGAGPVRVRPLVPIEGLGPRFEDNGGPGAVTAIAQGRSGTGASTMVDDSAAGGNAEQPERLLPQFGRGGGGGGGR